MTKKLTITTENGTELVISENMTCANGLRLTTIATKTPPGFFKQKSWPATADFFITASKEKLTAYVALDAATAAEYNKFFKESIRRKIADKQADLESKFPGLDELTAALNDVNRYHNEFDAMMEDEGNDGVFSPALPKADIGALKEKYPREAMYLQADGFCNASHHLKSAAGRKAKILLEDGGSITGAKEILDNWLPAGKIWD